MHSDEVKREPMLYLTREVRFSAGSEASARVWANTWAGWPAAVTLSPYLRLGVTLGGEPDPVTGYLCDIKFIDDWLQESVVPLASNPARWPAAREFLQAAWRQLAQEPFPGVRLVRLSLAPTPYVRYTVEQDSPDMIQYTEQFEFSAAHRLHCAELSAERNREVFGKCNNASGHGHNYVVEVTVSDSDPSVPGRSRLAQVVKEEVLDRFDHKHLNEDTAEFRRLNPTVENITRVIWQILVDALAPTQLVAVRVYETPKTWAECRGQ
jgi:6-pyruvoyltetrahydropterin/6-carboxytetrahydropterin synthase